MAHVRHLVPALALLLACGDDASRGEGGGDPSSSAAGPATVAAGGGGDRPDPVGSGGGTSAGGAPATSTGTSGGGGASSSSGGGGDLADPDLEGPYASTVVEATVASPSGNDVPLRALVPTDGPAAGPFPVVVLAHGFQLPVSQYRSYAERLASHGFVAITADYPADFFGVSNVDNAMDLVAALDWAAEALPEADADRAGMTGHSMGGKLSLLAATMDPRVRATINLDPVDGSMGCDPAECPDVSDLMPLDVPTGFLGETLDAVPSGFSPQACAPAADNYATFYAGTTAPSLSVTIAGAGHMSFLDDRAGCGFTCSVCAEPVTPDATVRALASAFVVAFYRRHLGDEVAYEAYLTGAEAQARYVATGLATISAK